MVIRSATLCGLFVLQCVGFTDKLAGQEPSFQGRPVSSWKKTIQKEPAEAFEAFGIVFSGKPDPQGIPVLIELLKDDDLEVCGFACNALKVNGTAAKVSIPALMELLKHADVFRRRNASGALAEVVSNDHGKEAIASFLRGIKEKDAMVNYHCAIGLGRLGIQAKDAIPALIELSKSDRAKQPYLESGPTVGDAAYWALKQIQPKKEKP